MKLIKGFGLLSFLIIISGSCFDPPEFPVTPQIEFDRIEFIDVADPSEFDSLNLYILFKDGDGDLGFYSSPEDISYPYHNADFFQAIEVDGKTKLQPLYTRTGYIDQDEYDLLEIPDPTQGKLMVFRSRKDSQYAHLLPQMFSCADYEYLGGPSRADNASDGRRLLVEAADLPALDPQVQLVDSFPKDRPEYYQIRDTLYYEPNRNHYNIEVDFLVKNSTGGFTEFDWQKEFCTTFDGRFPVFSDKQSSIDGTLRYSMTSLGFTTLFSIKTLKLRVKIRDRQLHESDAIETPEFTLVD